MKIVVCMTDPFPIGLAATNRMITYVRGMQENKAEVKVFCLKPSTIYNPAHGEYEKVPFSYTSGTSVWEGSKFHKLWLLIRGYVNGFFSVLKEKPDVILVESNDVFPILLCKLASIFSESKIVQEKSEFPFVLKKKGWGKIFAYLYVNTIYKFFDGIFCMTTPLQNYLQTRMRKNAKTLLVPMTVEAERFNIKKEDREPYVAYCGHLGGNKDGVDILLTAFAMISKQFPTYKLYIIGDGDKGDFTYYTELAAKLGLAEKTVFTGRVSRDEMPKYLKNASLLALARPTSLQAQGGFPTKLGEYLATKNPVIITAVGEIPLYLQDGVSAYLVEPDSPEKFAQKIREALTDDERAQKIGENGYRVMLEHFDYQKQSKKILDFLREL